MFDGGSIVLTSVYPCMTPTSRRHLYVRKHGPVFNTLLERNLLEISNGQVRLIGVVSAGRHPRNAINAVIGELPHNVEVVPIHKGHRWGALKCATCDATEAIWSTPRNADNHARSLLRFVAKHLHDEEG
ncbi:hypothetical protein GCM10017772_15990 [Promicromonospora soli]|uniref:Uncharacterized protein n=2 Tax=Promicromonospora soli TaxID=2035533 RepID=A0A919FPI5_9MICO|nr:hypothetical protein GCM10017772_15990 [Promicromonospora soli]